MDHAKGVPALDGDLAAFVCGGVAIVVATRDAGLVPAVTRGWGPVVSEAGSALTLCVVAPAGSRTRGNLETNGAIAIGFSPPTVARAVQVKGRARDVREPSTEDLDRARRHLDAFVAEAEQIGFADDPSRRGWLYVEDDFVCVGVAVEELFDQTPGPNAGRAL